MTLQVRCIKSESNQTLEPRFGGNDFCESGIHCLTHVDARCVPNWRSSSWSAAKTHPRPWGSIKVPKPSMNTRKVFTVTTPPVSEMIKDEQSHAVKMRAQPENTLIDRKSNHKTYNAHHTRFQVCEQKCTVIWCPDRSKVSLKYHSRSLIPFKMFTFKT